VRTGTKEVTHKPGKRTIEPCRYFMAKKLGRFQLGEAPTMAMVFVELRMLRM
jgi:hypothetical protein